MQRESNIRVSVSEQKMQYRPELDGLRFIAFFAVFLYHVGPVPVDKPPSLLQPLCKAYNTLSAWGWAGVDLFFVLSGFLITSLLLIERQNMGEVSFKHFFIRRLLRIWPLYFLALLAGCAVLYALGQAGVLWPFVRGCCVCDCL